MLSTFLFLPLSFLFSFALTRSSPNLVSVACCLPRSGRSGPTLPPHSRSLKFLPAQFSTWPDPTGNLSMPFVPCVFPSSLLGGGHPSCSCLALFIPGWVLCGLLSSRGASCSSFCFSSLLFLRSPLPRLARDPYIHLNNLMPRLMKLVINILDS